MTTILKIQKNIDKLKDNKKPFMKIINPSSQPFIPSSTKNEGIIKEDEKEILEEKFQISKINNEISNLHIEANHELSDQMNKIYKKTIKTGKKVFFETSIIDIHNIGDELISDISDDNNSIDTKEIIEKEKENHEEDKENKQHNNHNKFGTIDLCNNDFICKNSPDRLDSNNNEKVCGINSSSDNQKGKTFVEKYESLNLNLINQLKEEILYENKLEEKLKDEISNLETIQKNILHQLNIESGELKDKNQIHFSNLNSIKMNKEQNNKIKLLIANLKCKIKGNINRKNRGKHKEAERI